MYAPNMAYSVCDYAKIKRFAFRLLLVAMLLFVAEEADSCATNTNTVETHNTTADSAAKTLND